MTGPACRLCRGSTRTLFGRTVLARYPVRFHQCGTCGFTQTDEPTWLDEASASPVHPTDTGLLMRNLSVRRIVATFLHLSGVGHEPCLDWGGGYGVFTRLMRDAGFRFFHHDPYAPNLFARGFEWDDALGRPVACTALEVLEHFVHPLDEFGKIAAREADFIVTSTELHPGGAPSPEWHYLSVESGQHVGFYRADTLALLGRRCGYPVVIAGTYQQVFARRPFPVWRWRAAVRLAAVLYPLVARRRASLTVPDCERLRRSLRASPRQG